MSDVPLTDEVEAEWLKARAKHRTEVEKIAQLEADLAALRASLAPVREKLETITRWHGYDRIHISKPMLELVNDALRLLAGLEGEKPAP